MNENKDQSASREIVGVPILIEDGQPLPDELAKPDESSLNEDKASINHSIIEAQRVDYVVDETQHSMEFALDKKVQRKHNCKSVDAGPVSSGLRAVYSVGLCALVYGLVKNEKIDLLALQLAIVVGAFVLRLLYVQWKASRQTISKYVCSDEWLVSYGSDGSEMRKLNVRNIERATLYSDDADRKSIVISTGKETVELTGLEEPEKLLRKLPKKRQKDCSFMEKKLRNFVSSLHELKDADEMQILRDAKRFRESLQKELADSPDTIVLPESRSNWLFTCIFTLIFLVPTIFAAFIGYEQYTLPLLAVFFASFAQSLSKQLPLIDRCYVFTADALFELDKKRGTVSTITLDRICVRNQDDKGAQLNLEDQITLPVHIEKADQEFVNSCLKKYPSHFNSN